MPYARQQYRKELDKGIDEVIEKLKASPLEKIDANLNYVIFKILRRIYKMDYFDLNRAMGALETCKIEFYRRVIAPYEDGKMIEHGDVE